MTESPFHRGDLEEFRKYSDLVEFYSDRLKFLWDNT